MSDLKPGDSDRADLIRRGVWVPIHETWDGEGCPMCMAELPDSSVLEAALDYFETIPIQPCWYCTTKLYAQRLPKTDDEVRECARRTQEFCGCSQVQRFDQGGGLVSDLPGFDETGRCRHCRRPCAPTGWGMRPAPREGDYDHGPRQREIRELEEAAMRQHVEETTERVRRAREEAGLE